MTVTPAQIKALLGVLQNVDWADAAEAVASGFQDIKADEAIAGNLFELVAPILAPYIIAAVGVDAIPIVGQLVPLLIPTIALAAANFRGGDPDPVHDAQTGPGPQNHGRYVGR